MRFLIVQTGNKRITKRINVESITSIISRDNEVIIYYEDGKNYTKIYSKQSADEFADYIMNEITNTNKKVIDLRAGFVEPAEVVKEVIQEKIKAWTFFLFSFSNKKFSVMKWNKSKEYNVVGLMGNITELRSMLMEHCLVWWKNEGQ